MAFWVVLGLREPFMYLGKGRSTSDAAETVLLVSPFVQNDRVAYLRVDGSRRDEMLPANKRGDEKFQDMIREGIWPKNEQAPSR